MKNRFQLPSLVLFFLGIFTCTWDLFLTIDLGGLTFKIHQLFFGCSFLCTIFSLKKDFWAVLYERMASCHFSLCLLGLLLYYAITAPFSFFPLKSALYAIWILYNFLTIWVNGMLLRDLIQKKWLKDLVWLSLVTNALVVLIDHGAYQLGFSGGFLGFNQDPILKWGLSRPHSFAMEPSYIATFFALSIIFLYGYLLETRPWRNVPLNVLSFLAIFATGSRTGMVSLGIGATFLLVLDSCRKMRISWIHVIATLLLFSTSSGILYLVTPAKQRETFNKSLVTSIPQGRDGSANTRLKAHGYALQMAKDTGGIGVGLGASFRYWMETKPVYVVDKYDGYGHELIMSIWGQLLAEGGVPAVLFFFLAGFFMVKKLWIAWRVNPEPLTLGALVSAFVFFSFISFWIGNVARGDMWVWFFIWGYVASTLNKKAKS